MKEDMVNMLLKIEHKESFGEKRAKVSPKPVTFFLKPWKLFKLFYFPLILLGYRLCKIN